MCTLVCGFILRSLVCGLIRHTLLCGLIPRTLVCGLLAFGRLMCTLVCGFILSSLTCGLILRTLLCGLIPRREYRAIPNMFRSRVGPCTVHPTPVVGACLVTAGPVVVLLVAYVALFQATLGRSAILAIM